LGKPLHERIEAFRKHLADVEKSCVATFSNEHVTRARVDAIEAKISAWEADRAEIRKLFNVIAEESDLAVVRSRVHDELVKGFKMSEDSKTNE